MESRYQNALADVKRRLPLNLAEIPVNVAPTERAVSIAGGALLLASGLKRGGLLGTLGALAGGGLLFRGLTGRCGCYAALGVNTNEPTATPPQECEPSRPPAATGFAETGDAPDLVDEASMESFPASDAPAYSSRRT